jgi:hypothetical protein
MNQETFNCYFILILIVILAIAGYAGFKHIEYIEIMKHSPCDLCIKCPSNIVTTTNWSISYEFLNQNGTEIYSSLG